MKKYLLSAVFMITFILQGVLADEIKLTATSREVVSVGDRFQLSFTLNTDDGQFTAPQITDFRVLSGPNISHQQSYQVINGKMAKSSSVSYVYYLQAFKEGEFEITGASATVNGKEIKANPIRIEVVKGNVPQSIPKNQKGADGTDEQSQGGFKDDVFLKAFISNQNPYQGEQVIVTYKIYTANVPISEIEIDNIASFPGFWSTNLNDNNQRIQQNEEVINGREYLTGVLYQAALFPQKSGEITINEKTLKCTAQVRTQGNRKVKDPFFDSFFDDPFFNNQYQNIRLEMESNPLVLDVKPLPIDKKPAGFSGAVGRFTMEGSIDKTDLTVNDAISLKLVVSGSGNLELINTPEITFPPDFETYEPKITNNIKSNTSGVSGSRTFEFLAIPRSAGDFTVGPIELSYFDPTLGTYRTLASEAYHIHVEKGDQQTSSVTYSGVAQEDIMYLGQDIRYIRTGNFKLSTKDQYLFASLPFYIMLGTPPILLALLSFLIISNRRKRGNVALVKNRKATKVARKNLKKANEFLKTQKRDEFYTEVSRALWGYLSDKFNIPLSSLSMDSVRDRLSAKAVSKESIDSFIEVLNKCEFARFAPGESTNLMNEIYKEAISFISRIESELKS